MQGFQVTLEAQLNVVFVSPEKAQAFFIDGNWRGVFWEIEGLEELAQELTSAFHDAAEAFKVDEATDKGVRYRSMEGFGDYVKQDNGCYMLDTEDTGQIWIGYEFELETMGAGNIAHERMQSIIKAKDA